MAATILICCPDEEYIVGLESALAQSVGDDVQLSFISDADYLNQYIAEPHAVDYFLLN